MTADERIEIIRLKIKRAEKHLGDLHGGIAGFLESSPYKVRAECHPETRQPIYYIESVEPTPDPITAAIGDIIQNLRTALDHLAWQLVEIGCAEKSITLTAKDKRQIGFPISNDPSAIAYEPTLQRKVKGARNDVIKKIRALNPYKGGNDPLWQLNELNNIDKHRSVLTAGLSLIAISADSVFPQGFFRIHGSWGGIHTDRVTAGNLLLIPEKPIFPLQKDTQLFVDVIGAEIDLNDDKKFRFDIAFSEPGIIEAKSVLPTLVEFRNYVNGVVLSFRDDLV